MTPSDAKPFLLTPEKLTPDQWAEVVHELGPEALATGLHAFEEAQASLRSPAGASEAHLTELLDQTEAFLSRVQGIALHVKNRPGGLIVDRLADIEAKPVAWLWPDRVPRGKLTVFCGDAGLGKSSVVLDMIARTTQGRLWPESADRAPQGSAIILSAEDDAADTIKPRLEAMGADPARVWHIRAVCDRDGTRGFTLTRDLAHLQALIQRHHAMLVCIDPLSAYLGTADSWKDSEVRNLLEPLATLAAEEHAAVICVMHPSKAQQQQAIHRAVGSVAFTAVPRVVYLIVKDPQNPTRRLLATVKNNLAPIAPTVAYSFESVPEKVPGIKVARVIWDMTPVPLSAQQLVDGEGVNPSSDSPRLEYAKAFLKDLLKAGPVQAGEALRRGRVAGINERTMQRAREDLGMTVERVKGIAGDGVWVWAFPPLEGSQEGKATEGDK